MLELGLDVAGDEGGGEENHREQHEAFGDVPHESRRRPDLRQPMRVVLPVAIDDDREADQRDQREQRAIGHEPQPFDGIRAHRAERHEAMRGDKDDQSEDKDQ
jgi:hypothetical protein